MKVVSLEDIKKQNSDLFEEFWRIYPKSNGYLEARAVWTLIIRPDGWTTKIPLGDTGSRHTVTLQASPEDLVAATAKYVKYLPKKDFGIKEPEFLPRAANFLAKGLFMDYI